jgi:hypothetical protein
MMLLCLAASITSYLQWGNLDAAARPRRVIHCVRER